MYGVFCFVIIIIGFCEIAQLLDLDLDKKTIHTLYNLIDCGVNPDAIAAMIKEMRQTEWFGCKKINTNTKRFLL